MVRIHGRIDDRPVDLEVEVDAAKVLELILQLGELATQQSQQDATKEQP